MSWSRSKDQTKKGLKHYDGAWLSCAHALRGVRHLSSVLQHDQTTTATNAHVHSSTLMMLSSREKEEENEDERYENEITTSARNRQAFEGLYGTTGVQKG